MGLSFLMFLLLGGLTGDAGAPPRDLLSLLSPEVVLKQAALPTDDESLVAMLLSEEDDADFDAVKAAIADLDAEEFDVRERASQTLADAGAAALPLLEGAAKSDDPEVAARARKAIEAIRARREAELPDDVRLMLVIRLLEKRRTQAALPGLEKLAESGDAMVATVARDAMAAIRGEGPPARDARAGLAEALKRLPAGPVAVAAVNTADDTSDMSVTERVESVLAAEQIQPLAQMMPPQLREQMVQQATVGILTALRMVGNVRLDGAVLHVPETVAEPTRHLPYVGLVLTGLYSPSRVAALCEKVGMRRREGDGPPVYTNREVVLGLINNKTLAVAFATSGVENALPFVWSVSDGPVAEPDSDSEAARVVGMLAHEGARFVGAGRLTEFQKTEGLAEAIAELERTAAREQEGKAILEGFAAVVKGLLKAETYTVTAAGQKALIAVSYGEGEEGKARAHEARESMMHGIELARQGVAQLAQQMRNGGPAAGGAEKMIMGLLEGDPIEVDAEGPVLMLKLKGAGAVLPMMLFGVALPARAAVSNAAVREREVRARINARVAK